MARGPDNSLVSPSSSQRLDSWKEIAVYLQRSVSTVKRWERDEGLPVHRHLHGARGTVYAYRSEIDVWWHGREPQSEHGAGTGSTVLPRRVGLAVLGVAGLALLAIGVWWVAALSNRSGDAQQDSPALAFAERDWVLVSDFENRTGEPELDGTLEYALKRELSTSRFVNVVPRVRVEDVLRLMEKPAEGPIDRTFGREVCLRDGGIKALLSGRVDRLGGTYVLNVELTDPVAGGVVVVLDEEVASREELLPAIRRISIRVREALGETLPRFQSPEWRAQQVTTPSLRALQLYSQADALLRKTVEEGRMGDYPLIAEEMLKSAIELDPGFAAAHAWLAWACFYQGKPATEYMEHAIRARDLAATVHERERYAIVGSYHQLRAGWIGEASDEGEGPGDSRELIRAEADQAIAAWGALLSLYPDDFWAPVALGSTYSLIGRYADYTRQASLIADRRPGHFRSNFEAAWALATYAGDRARASRYLERAQAASEQGAEGGPWAVAWMRVYPAQEHWLRGEVDQTLSVADRLAAGLDSTARPLGDLADSVGFLYLGLGRLDAAEELFTALSDTWRHDRLALLAFVRGDESAMRRHLGRAQESDAIPKHRLFHLLVRLGELSQAEGIVPEFRRFVPGYSEVARGELDLTRGDAAAAVPWLRAGLDLLPLANSTYYFGAESLAAALRAQGDREGAVEALEAASKEKVRASMCFWIRNQLLLAAAYRDLGRVVEARVIEGELVELLRFADADHPLLLELDRLKGLDTSS